MDGVILPVVNQIIMLFLIAAIGLGLRLKGVFTDTVIKAINTTVLNVTWPCMAIMTTQKDYNEQTLYGFLFVLAVSVIGMTVAYLVAWLLFFRNRSDRVRPALINLSALPKMCIRDSPWQNQGGRPHRRAHERRTGCGQNRPL